MFSQVTGGNPALVRALLDDFLLSGPEPRPPQVVPGNNFGQAVRGCLCRFESPVGDVARGLAVLAESASPGLVARLFELPPGAVAAGIQALELAACLTRTATAMTARARRYSKDSPPRTGPRCITGPPACCTTRGRMPARWPGT